MNPILLVGTGVSLKKHMFLIACTLLFLVFMPMAAVFAIVSPTSLYTNPTGFYTGDGNPQDLYAWGNCTYWASLLRIQNGDPVPNTWGNANTCVGNRETKACDSADAMQILDPQNYFTSISKFNAVAKKINEHLTEATFVAA